MTCRCGDDATAHKHYRKGTDCALCGCPRFRVKLRDRFRGWLHRKPPPLPRRIPGLPVDGEELTDGEAARLIQIMCGLHDSAGDPGGQR